MSKITKDKEKLIDVKDKKIAKRNKTKDNTLKSSTSANKITSKNPTTKTTSSVKKKNTHNSRVADRCGPYKCEKKYVRI